MKRLPLPRVIIFIFLLIGFSDSLKISAQLYAPSQLFTNNVYGYQFSIVSDNDGNVYYCGQLQVGPAVVGKIYKYPKTGGVLDPNQVLIAEIPGAVFGMDMDKQGNLFCSTNDGRVFKIACLSSGSYNPVPQLIATIILNTNEQVLGMAVDRITGNIYLAETSGKRIYEITNNAGNYDPVYNSIPFNLVAYGYPQDLTCDQNGNLFGCISYDGVVFEGTRNASGGFDFSEITKVGNGANTIALDNCNNILVGSLYSTSLFEITNNGGVYNPVPLSIPLSRFPTAICVDKEGNIFSNNTSFGEIYIAKRNNPSITINSPVTQICPNSTVTFNSAVANTATSTFSYQWQVNGMNTGNGNTSFTINSLTDGDVVSCDVIDLAHCYTVKSNKIVMKVADATNPAVSIQASANTICEGNTVNFVATPSSNASIVSWQWFKNGIQVGNNNPDYADNTLLNGDNITCQLTTNNLCAASPVVTSNIITIIVNPLLNPAVGITASANYICYGSAVTFTANPSNGGPAPVYHWMKNGSTVGSNTATYTDNSINNNDNIYCILTGAGCLSSSTVVSNTVKMSVSPLLTPAAAISTLTGSVCPGKTVTFTATGTNLGNAPLYQWQKNGVMVGAGQASYTDNNPGNNDEIICIITSNEGCVSDHKVISNSIHVKVVALPANFLAADTSICEFGELEIRPLSTYRTYNWSTGSTNSTLTVKQPGKYWVDVSDINNCPGSDTILVSPKQCGLGFFIPNSFTPNNDGKNDIFRSMLYGDIKSFKLVVFNRWGNIVFQTRDARKGWDGTYLGRPQDSNLFIWQCSYELQGEQPQFRKGTVLLLR